MKRKKARDKGGTTAQPGEKTRVTVDLSPAAYERLRSLTDFTHLSSATVVRQALQLYEFITKRTAEGYTFKSVDKEKKEVEITFIGYTE